MRKYKLFTFIPMIKINFQEPTFTIRLHNGAHQVWDALRKQWLVLTPEEWVRQNFLQFLQQQLAYPSALIAVEKTLELGTLKKRFDILVYDRQHQPFLMVECKAMDVALNANVLQQLLGYHMAVPVPYLCITNGSYTQLWHKTNGHLVTMEHFPDV